MIDEMRPPRSLRSLPPGTPSRAGRRPGSQSASAREGDGRHATVRMSRLTVEAVAGQSLGTALRDSVNGPPRSLRSLPPEGEGQSLGTALRD